MSQQTFSPWVVLNLFQNPMAARDPVLPLGDIRRHRRDNKNSYLISHILYLIPSHENMEMFCIKCKIGVFFVTIDN